MINLIIVDNNGTINQLIDKMVDIYNNLSKNKNKGNI